MSRFGEPPYGEREARAWLDRQRTARADGRRLMLAIDEDGGLVGTIDIDCRERRAGPRASSATG